MLIVIKSFSQGRSSRKGFYLIAAALIVILYLIENVYVFSTFYGRSYKEVISFSVFTGV